MAQLQAIVDKLLSGVSSKYVPEGYISDQVLPVVTSVQKSGLLGGYGKGHLRIEQSLIGGRSKYRRVEPSSRSTTAYLIEGHGLEGLVTEDDYANVEEPFDAEQDEVIDLTTHLWLEREYALASTIMSTSVISQNTTLSGTDQYSDYANSEPVQDFATARATVKSGCGVPPNGAILSWEVWNMLRFHPQLLDALGFKDNRPGGLTEPELAIAMGVKKLLIGQVTYNSAKEGQSDVLAPVWGKDILFAVLPEKMAKRQVSLGYSVQMKGRGPARVMKEQSFNPPGTKVLVDFHYDDLISNAAAGYLIKSAIA